MSVDFGTTDVGNTPLPVDDADITSGSQKTQIVNSSGVDVDARDISTTPVNGDIGLITNSIIYGHTTAGGGSYVEVKVTPSGAVSADVSGSTVKVNDGTDLLLISATGAASTNLTEVGGAAYSLGQKPMAQSIPTTLASDQPSIPVTIGLPGFLASTFGFASSINQPTAAADNPLYYIRNPNGSGKNMYIKFTSYGIAVANTFGVIRLYKNPTVSANGTAQTIVSFGGGSTVALLNTVPTVTTNGTLLYTGVYGQNGASLLLNLDYEITIAPNNSVLITGAPGTNNRAAELAIRWAEIA